MTCLLQRQIRSTLPVAVSVQGIEIRDSAGRTYLDASGGAADGVNGDHVLLAPPFIVTPAHIDAIVERLGDAIASALAG